jgi:hypothetical protein
VLRARVSAWLFSACDLAKPDSATVPFSGSTPIAPALMV